MKVKVKSSNGLKFYRGYTVSKFQYKTYIGNTDIIAKPHIYIELEAIQKGHNVEIWSKDDRVIYRFGLHHTNAITKTEADRLCRTALTILGIK